MSWAQCLNYNVGVDATMWNGLLGVEFDVFYKYEYDKLATVTGAYAGGSEVVGGDVPLSVVGVGCDHEA